MTIRLTPQQAAKLGLATGTIRTSRRTAPGPYRTTCNTCGQEFLTQAAEDRHVAQTKHARYDLEIVSEP